MQRRELIIAGAGLLPGLSLAQGLDYPKAGATIRYVVPFLTQVWMYATPVVYSAKVVPEKWHWIYLANPIAGIVNAFRSSVLGRPFDVAEAGCSLACSLLLFVAGIVYFQRVERHFADVI